MSRRVVVVEPGTGQRVGNVEFLATSDDTPFFNVGIVVLRPGQGVESHRHQAEDDSWLVLDGTLTVTLADDERRVQAGPGTFVLVPVGTAHALANEGSEDVRLLNVHAPGGFDRRIGLGSSAPTAAAQQRSSAAQVALKPVPPSSDRRPERPAAHSTRRTS